MKNRRDFLRNTFGLGAGLAAAPRLFAALTQASGESMDMEHMGHARQGSGRIVSVETPDVPQLPWRMDGGAKEFHLIAEPVKQEIAARQDRSTCGDINGSAPGPTIQVNQGDRVRIIVDNHLPEPTSMHWHGFEIPIDMDGAPGSSQDPIPPGGRFVYEFTLHQEGTFFYHSHMAMQEMMGMIGVFIMHPKKPIEPAVDKDFRDHLAGVRSAPEQYHPELHEHGVQLADVQRQGRSGDHANDRPARRSRAHSPGQPRNGSPSDPRARPHFLVTGTEGGRIPETALVARQHRSRGGRPGARCRVRRQQSRSTGCCTATCRTT